MGRVPILLIQFVDCSNDLNAGFAIPVSVEEAVQGERVRNAI